MRNSLSVRVSAEEQCDPPLRGYDPYDQNEIDAPTPLQIFTRLGVLVTIALAFGLAAELLAQLPSH